MLRPRFHSHGAPAAVGSLVRCERCDGHGWTRAELPSAFVPRYALEHGAADTCWRCLGNGYFQLPMDAGHLDCIVAADGILPAEIELYLPEDWELCTGVRLFRREVA